MERIDFKIDLNKTRRTVTFDFDCLLTRLRKINTDEKAFSFIRELESTLFFTMVNDMYDKLQAIK